MCSFPRLLISMFKVQLKTEVTFPFREPTTQEEKQFGTDENIFTLS